MSSETWMGWEKPLIVISPHRGRSPRPPAAPWRAGSCYPLCQASTPSCPPGGDRLPEPMPAVSTLQAILDAFNRHDLDAIMAFFADDAVFESPHGPDPWGRHFEGKAAAASPTSAMATTTTSWPATAAHRNGP